MGQLRIKQNCLIFQSLSGPEVLFKTCVAMKFVDDDDDDELIWPSYGCIVLATNRCIIVYLLSVKSDHSPSTKKAELFHKHLNLICGHLGGGNAKPKKRLMKMK